MITGAPPGTLGLALKSEWMNAELFVQIMNHLIEYNNALNNNSELLIYDNHESHLSLYKQLT